MSRNGYEASGYAALRGPGTRPACVMLTGVSAGIMELLYGHGAMRERLGQYTGVETACRCMGNGQCRFVAEVVT